jgi:ABC-type nitrate/sulfonate/bicarbonate transport system substrate-binding protein
MDEMINSSARRFGARLAIQCIATAILVIAVTSDRAARAQTPANLEKVTIALDWVPTMPQHMGYWLAKS